MAEGGDSPVLDVNRIKELIPHRYPFLMVDRILEVVPGSNVVAIKNVTSNEPYFAGHFPTLPVMPGVMIIEAMAQSAACLVMVTLGPESEGKLVFFMAVESARFRKPVVPGDRMLINCRLIRRRGSAWKFTGEVLVDDVVAAEATCLAMVVDRE